MVTKRKPRVCEVCSDTYTPRDSKQRTCGRYCGVLLSRGPQVCEVVWSRCLVCMRWVTKRSLGRHDTCSAVCLEVTAPLLTRPVKDRSWQTTLIECPMCGSHFTNEYTTVAVHCSRRCSRKASKLRRRVREAQTYGEWRWSDFMRIARRFNYCCAYCGEKPERLDPDHVVPLSRGGPNTTTNLLPSCPQCNSQKRDLLLHEWEQERIDRNLPPRATSWAPEDKRYWHLTSLSVAVA